MKIRAGKFKAIFFTCLLLLSGFVHPAFAWPPPCPGCCYWNGDKCVDGSCGGCCECSGCSCIDDNSQCSTESCYECENCGCEYQCDLVNENCCDGTCVDKCWEYYYPDECSTSKGSDTCTECRLDSYPCDVGEKYVYTGVSQISCFEHCPGDCHEPVEVVCYTYYECEFWLLIPFSRCEIISGTSLPGCVFMDFNWPGTCNMCKLSTEGEQNYVTQTYCKEYR